MDPICIIVTPPDSAKLCFVQRTGARIGILAVPASGAQAVCDQMVDAGIRGILNFAPAHLRAPADVLVRHEDFAVSLALLAAGMESRADSLPDRKSVV